jgi:hypothetical protein
LNVSYGSNEVKKMVQYADETDLIPSIHPGKGSFHVLVVDVGRIMAIGSCNLCSYASISPIAFVKT